MIDPEVLTRLVLEHSVREEGGVVLRRYFRFRVDRWYGGIATADVVGCNLRCGMCWAWRNSSFRLDVGDFMRPDAVARRLAEMARSRGLAQLRISGGEPNIAPRHLLAVLKSVPESYTFIVETNGILIDRGLARELAGFPNVVVRVSIKGATPEEFSAITMSPPQYFYRQLDALRNLVEAGMVPCRDVYAAAMIGFSTDDGVRRLKEALGNIHEALAECLDEELVILYPHVVKLMRARGLRPLRAVAPSGVPQSMI
ncbi:MAG: radical SAM protein [Thermoproteus sp.]